MNTYKRNPWVQAEYHAKSFATPLCITLDVRQRPRYTAVTVFISHFAFEMVEL
jgi:hypothetical protein